MTLQVRRVVTGHDANGKAIVASDERMTGTSPPARPYIARCEIWSTDQMPVDNSEAAAVAQKKGFVVRHNYVGHGPGECRPDHRIRPRRAQIHAPHRDGRLRDPAV